MGLFKSKTRSVVGLDIEPGFLAAAEFTNNGKPTLTRAATTSLGPGLFHEGEVVDVEGLADRLRSFFREHDLPKRVRLGVASQKIAVRVLELPIIDNEQELDAAIRFQAQDELPMPLEQAVLDHRLLERVEDPEGGRMRVLIVAARRASVEHLLAAARRAGLNPELVDLSAFAMIRALYMPRHVVGAAGMVPGEVMPHLDVPGIGAADALPPELAPFVPESLEHDLEPSPFGDEAASFTPESGPGDLPVEFGDDLSDFERAQVEFDAPHEEGDDLPSYLSSEAPVPADTANELDQPHAGMEDVPAYLRQEPAAGHEPALGHDPVDLNEAPVELQDENADLGLESDALASPAPDHGDEVEQAQGPYVSVDTNLDLGHELAPAGDFAEMASQTPDFDQHDEYAPPPPPELAEPILPALDIEDSDAPELGGADADGIGGFDVESSADPDSLATMYCYIGGLTNLAIAVGTTCVFNRVLQNGVESMAATLAERRGLTLDHAREWIKYVGLERPVDVIEGEEEIVREAREVLENGARRIVDEVRLSIEYYHSTVPNAPRVDAAVMAGPGVTIAGLRSLFEKELGLPVEPRSMGQVEVRPGALDKVDAAHLTIATGLALEEVPA